MVSIYDKTESYVVRFPEYNALVGTTGVRGITQSSTDYNECILS